MTKPSSTSSMDNVNLIYQIKNVKIIEFRIINIGFSNALVIEKVQPYFFTYFKSCPPDVAIKDEHSFSAK